MKTIKKRLTAKDVCKGTYNINGETHCAWGWVFSVFSDERPHTISRALGRFSEFAGIEQIERWNDHSDPATVAATLNEFFIAEGALKS